MDFGLGLLGYHGSWDDAAFAESHGFATAGFVDSPLLGGDPFVCLGLAARTTVSMRIGTFLAVPGNRTAATTAAAIATVNRLAPGRTFLGVGTGNTSRNTFGLRPVAAARMARYAADCRALLNGGEATLGDTDRRYALGHRPGLYVDTRTSVPVYVAGDGPKALDAAGRTGDGWISTMMYSHLMATSPDLFAASREVVAGAGAGTDFYSILSSGICVLDEGESAVSQRALELVGPLAMLAFHAYADNPALADHLPPPIQDRLDVYEREVLARLPGGRDDRHRWVHRGHLSHLLPGEAEVLTDEIVRMTSLTGTAAEVCATLGRLEAAGLSNVSLWIPPHLTRQTVLDIEARVMPRLVETVNA